MKILMINGSPHEKGCTFIAMHEVEKELNAKGIETVWINVGNELLRTCTACGFCKKDAAHHCVFDDAVNEALEIAKTCDGYVIGSPVHYANPSGALISFLGRFFYGKEDIHRYKLGAVVVSCRRAGATAAIHALNSFITYGSMQPVATQYWPMVHGNTPEEVAQDLEGMQIMRTLGRNMAWRLEQKKLAEENGLALPELEKKVSTNFIR